MYFLGIISWLESVKHTKNQVWRYWKNLFESVTVDYSNKLRRGVKVNMQIFYLNSISQFETNFRSHCCSPNILQRRLLSRGCGSGADIGVRQIRIVCIPESKQKDGCFRTNFCFVISECSLWACLSFTQSQQADFLFIIQVECLCQL